MMLQIFQKTPIWVWVLLLGLIALGYTQTRHRLVGWRRMVVMPLAMLVFSLLGMVSAFGAGVGSLVPWLFAYLSVAALVGLNTRPTAARYDGQAKTFSIAGSWLPMGIILAIFLTKFAVGISLSMQPNLKTDLLFVSTICLLYGLFSGVFAGRALRLIRLAQTQALTA